MSNPEVVGLSYYPIKSCAAVVAPEVTLSEFGIDHDREWMLVGSNGQPLTQRTNPRLAVVKTSIEDASLVVTAPGVGELTVPLELNPDAEEVPVTLWKKPGTGRNEGPDAAGFFSEYLGKDARLLRVEQPRRVMSECRIDGASQRTGFADGFPILLASIDSLVALNEYLERPVTIDRFRPNIVIEGAPAYDEDYWRDVQIGDLRAFAVRACARCPMPNIDQQVGELPKERPVTEALRLGRQGFDVVDGSKGEFFGQNLVHVFEPGVTVKVGDKITVLERSDKRNWTLEKPNPSP